MIFRFQENAYIYGHDHEVSLLKAPKELKKKKKKKTRSPLQRGALLLKYRCFVILQNKFSDITIFVMLLLCDITISIL